MSTTPTTLSPISTAVSDATAIANAITAGIAAGKSNVAATESWFKTHERLILIVLGIIGAVFLTNHLLNNWAARDQIQAQTTTQQLSDQKAADNQLAAQVKAASDQYQQTITALTQQNAALAAAIQNRTVIVEQQQKTDATLPLPDLGKRWSTLGGFDDSHIVATTTGFNVDPVAALATTQTLEKVPALTQNLADTVTQMDNQTTKLGAASDLVSSLTAENSGLKTTITDEDKACTAKLNLANANAKKGKWKSFFYGVGTGAGVVAAGVIAVLVH